MSPEGHLSKLREAEGLIRLVENPGAGTSSSLKLAGFSKAEHASRQHSMMSWIHCLGFIVSAQ